MAFKADQNKPLNSLSAAHAGSGSLCPYLVFVQLAAVQTASQSIPTLHLVLALPSFISVGGAFLMVPAVSIGYTHCGWGRDCYDQPQCVEASSCAHFKSGVTSG